HPGALCPVVLVTEQAKTRRTSELGRSVSLRGKGPFVAPICASILSSSSRPLKAVGVIILPRSSLVIGQAGRRAGRTVRSELEEMHRERRVPRRLKPARPSTRDTER